MECLAEGSGQCPSMGGEGTTSKNGGEAPAFQLTETVLPGGHNLVDLKSGYSDSLCPKRSGIHGESKKPVSLASPARLPRPQSPACKLHSPGSAF